jgi:hypothetical protein
MGRWVGETQDSGHNHQGVNSLAHSGSLLKQTGEFGCQSSSEDFCFEPWTSSPGLSGQLKGIAPNTKSESHNPDSQKAKP